MKIREIKFRAWDKEDCVMGTVMGFSLYHGVVSVGIGNGRYLQDDSSRFYLMQYTGLEDKNGTEIYEGDIVQTGWQGNAKGVVEFENSTYCADSGNGYMYFNHPESYEVIGNIYENPELLKERDVR